MKLFILLLPLSLFAFVLAPPPLIPSIFTLSIAIGIFLVWSIIDILQRKSNNKDCSIINKIQTSLFIIPILSYVVSVFTYDSCNSYIENRQKLTCTQIGSIAYSLKMFKLDNGTYPSTQEGLEALVKNPNSKKYSNYLSFPSLLHGNAYKSNNKKR